VKTKTYVSVLQRATELTGRPYPPTPEEAGIFRGFIAKGLRKMWERWEWPETIETQQEYFSQIPDSSIIYPSGTFLYWTITKKYYQTIADISTASVAITDDSGASIEDGWYIEAKSSYPDAQTWDSTIEYEPGDIIYYPANGLYYAVRSAPSVPGYGPLSILSEMWGQVTPFIRSVDKLLNKDGTARTEEIGEVFRITREDPRVVINDFDVNYRFAGDLILTEEELPYCWIEFRKVPPELATDPDTIPYRFADYVAEYAAGLMLAVDGKVDLSTAVGAMSVETLNEECDKVANQEGQFNRTSVGVR